jgi:hypothetical protein
MLLHCGCTATSSGNKLGADFQDARYGKGMRVHTPKVTAKDAPKQYRCTVCSKERTKPGAVEKAKKAAEELAKTKS